MWRSAGRALLLLALSGSAACDLVFDLEGEVTPRDADADPDSADAVVSPFPCSTIHMIGNDFEDGNFQRSFGGDTPDRLSVIDGRLTLTAPDDSYVNVETKHFYDVSAQPITFRFGDTGIGNGNTATIRIAGDVTGREVVILRSSGTIRFSVSNGDPLTTLATLPYDPIEHAFVSVLFDNNTVAIATSADGRNFTHVATRALPDIQFVRITGQTHRPPGSPPLTFFLDDVMGGQRAGRACPSSDLRDDFAGEKLDRKWTPTAYNASGSSESGVFAIDLEAVASGSNAYSLVAGRLYDFTNNELAIEIPQMVRSAPELSFSLRVRGRGQDTIRLLQQGGAITATVEKANGTTLTAYTGAFDATAMRWWRMRNAGGMTFWEVSPEGAVWSLLAVQSDVVGLEAADAVVQVFSTSAIPEQARIDNINVLP